MTVILVVGIGLLVALTVVVLLRQGSQHVIDGNAQNANPPCSVSVEQLKKLPPSPIAKVPFHEALHTPALVRELAAYYLTEIGAVIGGDDFNAVIQSASFTRHHLELVYSFSDKAKHLYESGRAVIPIHRTSGHRLPYIADRSGVIIEQAKEANTIGLRWHRRAP